MSHTHEFTAEILEDGRLRVTILDLTWPRNAYNPATYTTVKNIDGSNRLMRDGGGWSFLPIDYEYAAGAAMANARGVDQRYPWMIPENHKIMNERVTA